MECVNAEQLVAIVTPIFLEKLAMEQVSTKYFYFPYQFSFRQMFHTHVSSGAGTIGKPVADVPSGLSLAPRKDII
jgi:hypothetical protein